VVPGVAHHVTQRGNRRERVFFDDEDYALYLGLIGAAAGKAGTEVWAWCLMPNHVHLVAVPSRPDGLARTFADAHRRYTGAINARHRWTGHLWQSRFGSVAMDEDHLAAAVAYVVANPVRARLAERAEDWPWSSARAYLCGVPDGLTTTAPMLSRFPDFAAYVEGQGARQEAVARLRRAEQSGRPVGSAGFIASLERRISRRLAPQKRGPKPSAVATDKGGTPTEKSKVSR
jgi:putative transposase